MITLNTLNEEWTRIFPVLKSEKRFQLLEYFEKNPSYKLIETVIHETGIAGNEMHHHINLLLSAGLIQNSTEKTGFNRHPKSFYMITPLGKKVLRSLSK